MSPASNEPTELILRDTHGWGGYDWRLTDEGKVRTYLCLCGDEFVSINSYAEHLVEIGRKLGG